MVAFHEEGLGRYVWALFHWIKHKIRNSVKIQLSQSRWQRSRWWISCLECLRGWTQLEMVLSCPKLRMRFHCSISWLQTRSDCGSCVGTRIQRMMKIFKTIWQTTSSSPAKILCVLSKFLFSTDSRDTTPGDKLDIRSMEQPNKANAGENSWLGSVQFSPGQPLIRSNVISAL